MDSIAIYSVFCGNSENKTFKAVPVDPRFPHFFISNNREVLTEASAIGWMPVFVDLEISDNPVVSATQSKIAKANPRTVRELLDFDFLCYKDDKRLLNMDGLADCASLLKEAEAAIGIRPHPFLDDNILFEFGESMKQPRYKSQWEMMVRYITEETEKGYKLQSQLYATGVILRNMRHEDTEVIDRTWFDHIERCGIECQISFDFVAQRFSSILPLPINLLV